MNRSSYIHCTVIKLILHQKYMMLVTVLFSGRVARCVEEREPLFAGGGGRGGEQGSQVQHDVTAAPVEEPSGGLQTHLHTERKQKR